MSALEWSQLPAGLEDMSPGPELAAALGSIDRAALDGYDAVVLVRARARQLAHDQAELMADMLAVGDRVRERTADLTSVWGSETPKLAAAEIAAALTWTKVTARARFDEAAFLVGRLPAVWAALHTGLIDLPKAKVFADGTGGLDEEVARRVAAELLPDAPRLTTGQLAYRLRKLVVDADPAAAKTNYERGLQERRVVHGSNPDGTAYLSGVSLPVEQAAAAYERVDAYARAAKQAGDARSIDHIRTDVYLGLLAGTWSGPAPVHRRGVVELTVDLPTLMGLADRAAELDGWGAVVADVARQIAAQSATRSATAGDAIWRFTVTDPVTGRALHHGTTRARPRKDPRRTLTARDKAFVIARDRTCRGPGCRTPARRSEIDHVVEHARGGPSRPWNTDCKCGFCHDLKDGGWRTERDAFGQTHWTSLLGHIHTVPPQPITSPQRLGPLEHHVFKITRQRT